MRNVLALIMLAVVSVASPSPTPVIPRPTFTAPTSSPAAPEPQTIMYVGDSITAGGLVAPADRINVRLQHALYGIATPTATIVNDGVGGQALLDGVSAVPSLSSTFPGLIATLHVGDTVIVQIGTNDLFAYGGDAAWTTAYVNLVSQAQTAGLHVLICQITPISSDHWNVELLRQSLNQWLADRFGNTFLARYPDVLHNQTTGQTWMDPSYMLPDGIHPNGNAYYRMADMDVAQLVANSWLN